MPSCPVCRDEFEDHVSVCPTDDVPLVPRAELPPPPVEEASLGVFHPAVARLVLAFLASKGVPFRVVEVDDLRTELRVPEPVRDRLRAELTLNWSGFLRGLEPEQQMDVVAGGGIQPGWHDAPEGAWIGPDGQLRVSLSAEEEDAADASRTLGPAIAVLGVVILLLAWVTGFSMGNVFLGIGAISLGLLLPR